MQHINSIDPIFCSLQRTLTPIDPYPFKNPYYTWTRQNINSNGENLRENLGTLPQFMTMVTSQLIKPMWTTSPLWAEGPHNLIRIIKGAYTYGLMINSSIETFENTCCPKYGMGTYSTPQTSDSNRSFIITPYGLICANCKHHKTGRECRNPHNVLAYTVYRYPGGRHTSSIHLVPLIMPNVYYMCHIPNRSLPCNVFCHIALPPARSSA